MPAMHFHLRWPDRSETRCYSPSLVIKDYLVPGSSYPLPEFLDRSREALHIASERVRAKFGYACSMAMDQLAQIEATAGRFDTQAEVEVLRFDEA
ncbi:MSMEG_0570 family nitrogen starvation response protein [Methylibium petroleiphilum]|uniref:MSMEG_0570 family nitrogen starvation response protein n=1 Tax=Methylibium petroleiphilum TaxID=105560 RepID=UPI001AD590ED|nr:MSMEG_0570 family nitrogen starvation response protein [Methylibium petroleiphilum]MBN9205590.1 MSMEG_0570 family nitrogen starvation response protein [Methylibium petroleiphilum]